MQKQENLSMYDSVTPGPLPGVWKFKTSQKLRRGKEGITEEDISASQSLIVEDPVFSVPPEAVIQRTPLPDTQGSYTDVIPHIVLKGVAGFGRGGFALLLLKEEEYRDCVRETTVEEYLKPRSDILRPDGEACGKDTLIQPCTCLRLSRRLFEEIGPKKKELPYLTHYRQVYIGDKPEMELDSQGIFTVVISNRIPEYTEGIRTAYEAHLVSLKGAYTCYEKPEEVRDLELISMVRWKFSVTGKRPDSFRRICERLKREGEVSDLLLKLPVHNGMEQVRERLEEGFVPMLYHLRTGEEGLCWSRSPLVPLKCGSRAEGVIFETADSALCYDEHDGVFDVSLAAAFEAGRTAALQDGAYLDTLLALRKKAQSLMDELLEKQLLGFDRKEGYEKSISAMIPEEGLKEEEYRQNPGQENFREKEKGFLVMKSPVFPEGSREDVENIMKRETEKLIPRLEDEGKKVAQFLARLLLFYPLSFDSLVLHEALLPEESVRFFYVDENYRQALYDGAVSLGLYSSRQSLLNHLLRSYLYQASEREALNYRAELYGEKPPEGTGVISGFLVRAKVVAYWPSVSIEARDERGRRLAILRMEHLSPDILIVLFDGSARTVILNEPEEGLALKIDEREYPGFREGTHVLDLDPDKEGSLISLIGKKRQVLPHTIGSAALAREFLVTGERTVFGEVGAE